MQNREFENKVQQKMEELQLSPADALWDKIEAELPEKKPRRRIFLILFFVLLLASSGIIILLKGDNEENITAASAEAPVFVIGEDTLLEKLHNNATGKQLTISIKSDAIITKTTLPKNQKALDKKSKQAATIISGKPATASSNITNVTTAEDETDFSPKKTYKYASKTKISIKAPSIAEEYEEENSIENYMLPVLFNSPLSINSTKINLLQETLLEKIFVPDVDSAFNVSKHQKNETNKRNNKPWSYGVVVAGGTSGIMNTGAGQSFLFNNNSATTGGSGGQATQSQSGSLSNPHTKNAFEIGFWANKEITARWRLSTGVDYTRQSNYLLVGKKVDSAVSVSFDMNKSIEAENYYQPGGSTKYVNRYNLFQIPIMMQYRPLKKLPLYTEAGVTTSILFNTNALVYNYASRAYVTSPRLFNKIVLSANAGVTADLNIKNVLPFSIGFNVRYGVSSVTKSTYGKQHFTNVLVYLKVPLKK